MITQTKKVAPINGTPIKRTVDSNVFKSTDYAIFKRMTGNRIVDGSHVNRLKESMKTHDLMIPIIVNERMEVVDGQHRLQARTELEIPVYYVIINGLTIQDTQKANANNKNWGARDYLNYYCELNYHYYKVFREFMTRFQFDIQICMALLANQTVTSADFRNGEFIVNKNNRGVEIAEKVFQLEPFYSGFRRRSFVFALIKCMENEKFDFEEFINKISYQSSKLVHCATVDQYLRIIEDVYNYKRKSEDKIRFR